MFDRGQRCFVLNVLLTI